MARYRIVTDYPSGFVLEKKSPLLGWKGIHLGDLEYCRDRLACCIEEENFKPTVIESSDG